MTASFLQASLFTSVVAFGVAAFAVGMGVLSLLIGAGIGALDKRTVRRGHQHDQRTDRSWTTPGARRPSGGRASHVALVRRSGCGSERRCAAVTKARRSRVRAVAAMSYPAARWANVVPPTSTPARAASSARGSRPVMTLRSRT